MAWSWKEITVKNIPGEGHWSFGRHLSSLRMAQGKRGKYLIAYIQVYSQVDTGVAYPCYLFVLYENRPDWVQLGTFRKYDAAVNFARREDSRKWKKNPGTRWHRKQENIHLKKHKGAMSKLGAKYYEGKIHAHQDSIREGWKRKPRRKK